MAYMECVAEVSKLDNGYVVSARMPLKPEGSDIGCACPVDRKEKNVYCRTSEEVAEKISALLMWVHDDHQGEYEAAFKEAAE